MWQSVEFHETEKTIKNVTSASQETQTSRLSKRRKNFWTCAKKPTKLNNLSVCSDK